MYLSFTQLKGVSKQTKPPPICVTGIFLQELNLIQTNVITLFLITYLLF